VTWSTNEAMENLSSGGETRKGEPKLALTFKTVDT
jgi:hypothetical protein